MQKARTLVNPRLTILRREIDEWVLKPLRSCGWSASTIREVDYGDYIEIAASRKTVIIRIAVLYSSGTSNAIYRELSDRVDHIFFFGQANGLESYTRGITVSVGPLSDFLPFLINMNKRIEPDRSPPVMAHKTPRILRLIAENPLETVMARLQQFTSVKLAARLVERRNSQAEPSLSDRQVRGKAIGISYTMRSALDYLVPKSSDRLNARVVRLYYGTLALAQAEMLASPSGPEDLEQVEAMTKQGHGLYTFSMPSGGFADLHVGVLATGFMSEWMKFLGRDISGYPKKRARSTEDLDKIPVGGVCPLQSLFASMPEIDDLFSEVFGASPKWISVRHDTRFNMRHPLQESTVEKSDSTYVLLVDRSGKVSARDLEDAGWPMAEVQRVPDWKEETGIAFRARVDHAGHEYWWGVLPIHRAPFGKQSTLLFPTLGGHVEYRTIAAVTLYALSIMARYMPSTWRGIEGGDDDQYLALVNAALAVWERLLPEQFLETIAGETVHTAQPGSFFA